jgi:uncharacterized coiled-coil protein SlyX
MALEYMRQMAYIASQQAEIDQMKAKLRELVK